MFFSRSTYKNELLLKNKLQHNRLKSYGIILNDHVCMQTLLHTYPGCLAGAPRWRGGKKNRIEWATGCGRKGRASPESVAPERGTTRRRDDEAKRWRRALAVGSHVSRRTPVGCPRGLSQPSPQPPPPYNTLVTRLTGAVEWSASSTWF